MTTVCLGTSPPHAASPCDWTWPSPPSTWCTTYASDTTTELRRSIYCRESTTPSKSFAAYHVSKRVSHAKRPEPKRKVASSSVSVGTSLSSSERNWTSHISSTPPELTPGHGSVMQKKTVLTRTVAPLYHFVRLRFLVGDWCIHQYGYGFLERRTIYSIVGRISYIRVNVKETFSNRSNISRQESFSLNTVSRC